MRATERDVLLFLLAVSAGSADAWSYLCLGHAFVANMTGNTVLAGIAIFQQNGDIFHPLLALCCYAAGTATAALFTRKVREGAVWAHAITITLLFEAVLMACAEIGWLYLRHSFSSGPALSHYLNILLGCVAFAIGLQSGAMLRLQIPGIVTTYITGTWTNLVTGIVHFQSDKKSETPRQKLRYEQRLFLQAGILAVYFLSAVLAGWLFRHRPTAIGALTALSSLTVAVYAALRA